MLGGSTSMSKLPDRSSSWRGPMPLRAALVAWRSPPKASNWHLFGRFGGLEKGRVSERRG